MKINYKAFIEDSFLIIDKKGKIVPLIFNDTQNYYWELLRSEYPTLQGIRENILKFRQPGFSTFIDALLGTDFVFSEEGHQDITFSDIYSHKDSETKTLFKRISFYLDSYLVKKANGKMTTEEWIALVQDQAYVSSLRKTILVEDTTGKMVGKKKSEITVQTANAKVSGRGGTKQNLHFSEPAFYPNTEVLNANDLVLGAEQQVADKVGKIFRESTGNMIGDFFNEEYEFGKKEGARFKSRFLGWWLHKEYSLQAPENWVVPDKYDKIMKFGATRDQAYWHYNKVMSSKPADREKVAREYPCDDIEAFLQQGKLYFDVEALRKYKDQYQMEKPLRELYQYV